MNITSVRRRLAMIKRATLRRAKLSTSWLLGLARHGKRSIITTPNVGLRLGNFLYVWLQAYVRSTPGSPAVALATTGMAPWLEAFPELHKLTLDRREVRFIDRREWDEKHLYQRFGTDFDAEDLAAFVSEFLAPRITPDLTGTIVVNVRRGDYYTDFYEKYAFDQVGYIADAMERIGTGATVKVVSDDPDWCKEHLDELLRRHGGTVRYDVADPLQNFLTLCGASRLIGSNSTFSYWGAYVANVIHPDATIIMPKFHGRMGEGKTDAHQLDPRWIAVEGFH
jgi:hypothetical protein